MPWTSTALPCPLPAPTDAAVTETSVHTGTACLALMDRETVSEVWEDLLYDGHGHEHGDGGLMLQDGAIGTHFEHDGDFPVRLFSNAEGKVLGLEIDLDPYAEDLDSLRRPADWTDEDEHAHAHSHGHAHTHGDDHSHGDDHEHGHAPVADGWSEPVQVSLYRDTAVLGDPAGLPEADDLGGLLDIVWPSAGGWVKAATYSSGGLRRLMVVVFQD